MKILGCSRLRPGEGNAAYNRGRSQTSFDRPRGTILLMNIIEMRIRLSDLPTLQLLASRSGEALKGDGSRHVHRVIGNVRPIGHSRSECIIPVQAPFTLMAR